MSKVNKKLICELVKRGCPVKDIDMPQQVLFEKHMCEQRNI
jgi:hypothetical protein